MAAVAQAPAQAVAARDAPNNNQYTAPTATGTPVNPAEGDL